MYKYKKANSGYIWYTDIHFTLYELRAIRVDESEWENEKKRDKKIKREREKDLKETDKYSVIM